MTTEEFLLSLCTKVVVTVEAKQDGRRWTTEQIAAATREVLQEEREEARLCGE